MTNKPFKFTINPSSEEALFNNISYQLDVLIRMFGLAFASFSVDGRDTEEKLQTSQFLVKIMEIMVDQYNKDVGCEVIPEDIIDKIKKMKVS